MSYYYLNRIIEYGLYLLVFLLPLQTRWIIKLGESEYETISLYGTDLLLILLLFLFVIFKFQISNFKFQINHKYPISNIQYPILWFLIIGLELVIFISIFFAADKPVAIYKYAVFLLGIGLFWLIVSVNYNKIKLIYCFFAGIFLQAGLGIWQFLTQSSSACKWLGMAEHDAGELGTSVIETLAGERWLRAYGGLDHPNVFGGLLVVGLLFIIGLIIKHSDFKDKKLEIGNWKLDISQISNFKFQISDIALLSAVCCLLSALFFTFSRGAWLGLIIGAIVILAIMVIKKDLLGQKKLLQIILASSILIFILFSQFQDLVLTRLSNNARLEVKSNVERIESYKDSWELIKDNRLFGIGIGNYTSEIGNLKFEIGNDNAKPSLHYQPVHNVFLLVWAEIGIIGLAFFIIFLLCVMRYALCDKTNLESKNLNIKISLLTAMIIMFLVDHWFWSLHFGVLLFWLVLGLIIQKRAVVNN